MYLYYGHQNSHLQVYYPCMYICILNLVESIHSNNQYSPYMSDWILWAPTYSWNRSVGFSALEILIFCLIKTCERLPNVKERLFNFVFLDSHYCFGSLRRFLFRRCSNFQPTCVSLFQKDVAMRSVCIQRYVIVVYDCSSCILFLPHKYLQKHNLIQYVGILFNL